MYQIRTAVTNGVDKRHDLRKNEGKVKVVGENCLCVAGVLSVVITDQNYVGGRKVSSIGRWDCVSVVWFGSCFTPLSSPICESCSLAGFYHPLLMSLFQSLPSYSLILSSCRFISTLPNQALFIFVLWEDARIALLNFAGLIRVVWPKNTILLPRPKYCFYLFHICAEFVVVLYSIRFVFFEFVTIILKFIFS